MKTKPFTIYVIQSAHTDIGYTHPQEQIALMYLDYYQRVLDLCRTSQNRPEAHRFKWVCETAWQVKNFVTACPEKEEEFLQYVRSGQIEITASYLHFADMIDADAYARSLKWVIDYCQKHDLPLRSALHCDINGWPWAVADILAEHEIDFFVSQVHIDNATDPLGERGSIHYHWLEQFGGLPTAIQLEGSGDSKVRMPQAFWWQGPKGKRVLHWLNEHYHLGNVLGLSSHHNYYNDKTRYFLETDRRTSADLYAVAEVEVPKYVERMQQDGYPHPIMLMSTSGFYTDNSPPDGRWCEIIERWNAEHTDIVLKTATVSEWYDALQTLDQESWPTYQVAWPDHWAHGLGSTTARIAQARRMQRNRKNTIAIIEQAEQAKNSQPTRFLEIALEQERLALEHTFNAWSTTAHPTSALNEFQKAAKDLRFHRAELYFNEAIGTALRVLMPEAKPETGLYVLSNDSGCHNSDDDDNETLRSVHFDAGDVQPDPKNQVLVDSEGNRYPFQLDHPSPPQFIAAVPVKVANLAEFRLEATDNDARPEPVQPQFSIKTGDWQLTVDPASGGLASLKELASGHEWVDSSHQHAFGQLVHETVVHPLGREAVGNTARLMALDVVGEQQRSAFADTPVFEHTLLKIDPDVELVSGPVFDAIELKGVADPIGRVKISWRVFHNLPVVELVLDWDKRWSDLPEAAYVAFPFTGQNGSLALESGGGFFQPGSHETGGQLPGTCSHYYTIQRAAHITAENDASLLWLPLDAPLVMPNEINYNRWETDPWDWNGFLASMPVNHYWHTNFATSQRGNIRLRYRFVSPKAWTDNESAIQSGLPLDALGWR